MDVVTQAYDNENLEKLSNPLSENCKNCGISRLVVSIIKSAWKNANSCKNK